uniref:S100 calcium binding protein A14 n=1 Tax=Pavo cristatus TaxID=9049 RepID=A0A8C9FEI2_PAVCR
MGRGGVGGTGPPGGRIGVLWEGGGVREQCVGIGSCRDNQELTDVERAIETVINQFHCYAVKGQKEYLTPNEMRELVVQKLPHLGKVGCVGPLDEKIECMGDPDEAKLEFGEYWDMMGDAAKGCRRK